MAINFEQILNTQAERIDREQAIATAELEAARLSMDPLGTNDAAQRVLQLDAERAALAGRANSYIQQRQMQPEQNKYGLSPDEIDHARIAGVSEDVYAAQKRKLAQMRATGEYPAFGRA